MDVTGNVSLISNITSESVQRIDLKRKFQEEQQCALRSLANWQQEAYESFSSYSVSLIESSDTIQDDTITNVVDPSIAAAILAKKRVLKWQEVFSTTAKNNRKNTHLDGKNTPVDGKKIAQDGVFKVPLPKTQLPTNTEKQVAVVLHDWFFSFKSRTWVIIGKIIDDRGKTKKYTSKSLFLHYHRNKARELTSADGERTIILNGLCSSSGNNSKPSEYVDHPEFIKLKFRHGFPKDWKEALQIWEDFNLCGQPVDYQWPLRDCSLHTSCSTVVSNFTSVTNRVAPVVNLDKGLESGAAIEISRNIGVEVDPSFSMKKFLNSSEVGLPSMSGITDLTKLRPCKLPSNVAESLNLSPQKSVGKAAETSKPVSSKICQSNTAKYSTSCRSKLFSNVKSPTPLTGKFRSLSKSSTKGLEVRKIEKMLTEPNSNSILQNHKSSKDAREARLHSMMGDADLSSTKTSNSKYTFEAKNSKFRFLDTSKNLNTSDNSASKPASDRCVHQTKQPRQAKQDLVVEPRSKEAQPTPSPDLEEEHSKYDHIQVQPTSLPIKHTLPTSNGAVVQNTLVDSSLQLEVSQTTPGGTSRPQPATGNRARSAITLLSNWGPVLSGVDLLLAGDIVNANGRVLCSGHLSHPVAVASRSSTITTIDGMQYSLLGLISAAAKKDLPKHIAMKYFNKNLFPCHWRKMVGDWICFLPEKFERRVGLRQRRNPISYWNVGDDGSELAWDNASSKNVLLNHSRNAHKEKITNISKKVATVHTSKSRTNSFTKRLRKRTTRRISSTSEDSSEDDSISHGHQLKSMKLKSLQADNHHLEEMPLIELSSNQCARLQQSVHKKQNQTSKLAESCPGDRTHYRRSCSKDINSSNKSAYHVDSDNSTSSDSGQHSGCLERAARCQVYHKKSLASNNEICARSINSIQNDANKNVQKLPQSLNKSGLSPKVQDVKSNKVVVAKTVSDKSVSKARYLPWMNDGSDSESSSDADYCGPEVNVTVRQHSPMSVSSDKEESVYPNGAICDFAKSVGTGTQLLSGSDSLASMSTLILGESLILKQGSNVKSSTIVGLHKNVGDSSILNSSFSIIFSETDPRLRGGQ